MYTRCSNDINGSFSTYEVDPAVVVVVVPGCEVVPGETVGVGLEEDGAHGFGRGFVLGAPWGVDGPGGVGPGGGAAMNMISVRTTT